MNLSPLVLIFSTVWPEPESSAAGVRQLQWAKIFKHMGFKVVLSSPAKFKAQGEYETLALPLNDSRVVEEIKKLKPEVVMFDRFILEEQFGHLVYEACPHVLILLETQDLHLVRRAREAVKSEYLAMRDVSPSFYQTETAVRETASILRVDHSFVISSFEEALLKSHFEIDADRVSWVPLYYTEPVDQQSHDRAFSQREGFAWVGNFRHAPNREGLKWFRAKIWPLVRKRISNASIKIYGSYPSQEVMEWNHPASGFHVLGPAKNLDSVFQSARVNLAPLQFGAGVKGKILEGLRRGIPTVTTKVGFEGIMPLDWPNDAFPGLIANEEHSFADACVALHESETQWNGLRAKSISLMNEIYSEAEQEPKVQNLIAELINQKLKNHLPNWTSRILRSELGNSRKYFSKWIEQKELNIPKSE